MPGEFGRFLFCVFSSIAVRFDGSSCPVIVLSQGFAPHPAKEPFTLRPAPSLTARRAREPWVPVNDTMSMALAHFW